MVYYIILGINYKLHLRNDVAPQPLTNGWAFTNLWALISEKIGKQMGWMCAEKYEYIQITH